MDNNWHSFFDPLPGEVHMADFDSSHLGANIQFHSVEQGMPEIFGNSAPDLVLVGCGYDTYDLAAKLHDTPNAIRQHFYRLYKGDYTIKVADVGNFNLKTNFSDVNHNLGKFLAAVVQNGITPILLGGGRELALCLYTAFKKQEQFANLLNVSSSIAYKEDIESIRGDNYIAAILHEKDNYLFNLSQLAHQAYFVAQELHQVLNDFNFDLMPLGKLRNDFRLAEPIVRDAHLIQLDIGSVKKSDAPHTAFGSANGLYAEELCRIARYAGLSEKAKAICVSGILPAATPEWADAELAAQAIWYFVEGFYMRKPESLNINEAHYVKFTIPLNTHYDKIEFLKNKISEKWWMSVPLSHRNRKKYAIEFYLAPCSEKDYNEASRGELPERWTKFYSKLND